MPSLTPLGIYRRYRDAIARITVVNQDGDLPSGAGFHIGSGYFVTARHVVENMQIDEIVSEHGVGEALEVGNVILSREPNVDLAIVKTNFNRARHFNKNQVIPIGMHFDDWVDDGLTMTNVVLMGYPPIPFATPLVTVTGQISAVLDRYDIRRVHLVVSTMARGGLWRTRHKRIRFSARRCYGVFTAHESMPETGFTAVLSTEGLWDILFDNHLLPAGVNGESMVERFPHWLEDWTEAERTIACAGQRVFHAGGSPARPPSKRGLKPRAGVQPLVGRG